MLRETTTNEIQKQYKQQREKFVRVLKIGTSISQSVAGRFVDYRSGMTSILFTRLCTTAFSISNLAPKTFNYLTHWDCVSLLSLTRNLIENYHIFFYFCIEKISQEEWEFRKLLFDLNDTKNRHDMLNFWGEENSEIFDKMRQKLLEQIQENIFFQNIDKKQQKSFLNGNNAFAFSRDEIEERMGNDKLYFKGLYKFLSNQTHTFPMSFSRMSEQQKGKGIESDIEVGYSMQALELSTNYFLEASKNMLNVFPDIKTAFEVKINNEESTNA